MIISKMDGTRDTINLSDIRSISFKSDVPPPSTTDLVAYYPFEGNAADSSGHGKTGIAYGTYSYVSGVHGQGIRLVGDNTGYHSTGGYVQIPQLDTTGLKELTVSVWIKEDYISPGDGYVFLSSDYEQGWCGIGHFQTNYNFAVGATKDILPVWFPFDSLTYEVWTLYTLAWSHDTISAYVNGQLRGSTWQKLQIYGGLATIGSHIWGGAYAGSSTHFTGDVDEVRIYRRALSSNEILGLYLAGI